MKEKSFKCELFKIFYNQNGHLSIICGKTGDKWNVLNYNGSIYTIYDGGNPGYKETEMMDVKEFFDNFPEQKVAYKDCMDIYIKIKEKCLGENKTNKLLLIL